jgi:hypothetical protein
VIDTPETPIPGPESAADVSTDALPAEGIPESAQDEPDTFDRAYVESLRSENAKYRTRAQQTDDYAQQLHRALVEKTGRLADPADVPFSDDHLTDPDALNAAIDSVLAEHPHYSARRPVPGTTVGQGVKGDAPKQQANLIGVLRSAHGWA